jgi:hypothetical protein
MTVLPSEYQSGFGSRGGDRGLVVVPGGARNAVVMRVVEIGGIEPPTPGLPLAETPQRIRESRL